MAPEQDEAVPRVRWTRHSVMANSEGTSCPMPRLKEPFGVVAGQWNRGCGTCTSGDSLSGPFPQAARARRIPSRSTLSAGGDLCQEPTGEAQVPRRRGGRIPVSALGLPLVGLCSSVRPHRSAAEVVTSGERPTAVIVRRRCQGVPSAPGTARTLVTNGLLVDQFRSPMRAGQVIVCLEAAQPSAT